MPSLVSIIVPVYNSSNYLHSCLSSVISQNYPSLEIIVINDGSTDNSEVIINEYIEKDSRIKLVSQENQGLGATRNKGINLSQGQYVFFLDSDDILPQNSIQNLVSMMEKSNADIAVGKVLRFNEQRKYVPIRHMEFNLYDENMTTTIINNPELIQDSIACNKLWRKEFLLKNNLFFIEGKYYEDLNLTLKGSVLAKKIEVTKETVYLWRVRNNDDAPSITQEQMKLNNTRDRINALQDNRGWLINSGYSEELIEEHDFKILLDILRLHVSKYCLIEESQINNWKTIVIEFLQQIPLRIVKKLPDKEKILYDLLMSRNYTDLVLFTQMLTNTELEPIVKQVKEKFILEGTIKDLDITRFLKPKVVVTDIIKNKLHTWDVIGTITIPKATQAINGEIIGISRTNNRRLKLGSVFSDYLSDAIYPFEKQSFKVILKLKDLGKIQKGEVFDFYFHLPEYRDYKKTRIISLVRKSNRIFFTKKTFTLYQTNNGNLSLAITGLNVKLLLKMLLNTLARN